MDDDLLPNDKQYSIVHRDRWKPLGHPDEEVKKYETDNLHAVPRPDYDGISVLAYDADGNLFELTEKEGDEEAQERIKGVMKVLKEET